MTPKPHTITEEILKEHADKFLDSFCKEQRFLGHNAYLDQFSGIKAKYVLNWAEEMLEQALHRQREEIEESKNQAYWERNQLVSLLSRLYPSHLALHDHKDENWEPEWRFIICVHTPESQATWHIHNDDLKYFQHLVKTEDSPDSLEKANHWDGHTTKEKYMRLGKLQSEREELVKSLRMPNSLITQRLSYNQMDREAESYRQGKNDGRNEAIDEFNKKLDELLK